METISQSVGKGGVNLPPDVKTIQTLLNKVGIPHASVPLKVDGKAGEKTFSRIQAFQKKHLLIVNPDGRIDVNGKTFNKLIQMILSSKIKAKLGVSIKGLDLLKSIEELAIVPYDDQTGKDIKSWVKGATIGYGHLIAREDWDKYKNGITEEQANDLFKKDLAPFENSVNSALTTSVSQNQFDALVMLAFNIGTSAIPKSSVLKLINDPAAITAYPNLESAWKSWNKSQGVINAGLNNRRQAEWNIYSQNIYKKW